jgi:rSAM/selenodomain-associated transferase 1
MVDLANAACTAILTRAPSTGGKTRLFAQLARDRDPALLTSLLLDTIDASRAPGVRQGVCVEPASACAELRALLPPELFVVPQRPGTLGERMRGAFADLFAAGAAACALIGSDLPQVDARQVAQAFRWLAEDPHLLVLGPATDGGYYLIAATCVHPVFDDIPWGSAGVLARTIEAAHDARVAVRLLDPSSDVDTRDDLQRIVDAGSGVAESTARRTRAWALANGITTSRGNVTSSGSS